MKKLALLLLAPTLCLAQTQIGPASGTNAGIQIGGNQPGVSSIQGQTGDFTFNGGGFSGCSTDAGVTTCTFTGGGSSVSLTTNRASGLASLSGGVLNVPTYYGGNVFSMPNFSSLVGAFTDGSGNVIQPINIGNGPTVFYVPSGATQLQLGVNDDLLTDLTGSWTISVNGTNYSVPGTTTPWSNVGGLNPGYPIYPGDLTGGVTAPVVAPIGAKGTPVTISYVSGTVNNHQYCGLGAFVPFDASGQANCALSVGNFGILPAMWTLSADAAGSGSSLTLTTTGSSGAATYTGGVLNIPIYSGGTVPGGTTTQLQYNNAGAFGGDTGSTTDGAGNVTTKTVTTTGTVAGQGGTWDATEGTAPSGAASHDLVYASSSAHQPLKNPNNTGAKAIVGTSTTAATAGNCVQYAANGYDIADAGAACGTGGGGGGYTNVTGTTTETTVALLNAIPACSGGGTLYATTPLSIATGGTVSCPVQFSKAGLWTIASGQTVTFTYPVTKTDAATQIFAGSGSVVLAAQDAPAAWFGAVGDGVYSAGTGTDNAASFQKTIDSITVGNMVLACATYKSASVVNVHARNNVGIKGCQTNSKGNTTGTVVFTTSASATIFDFAGTGVTQLTYMYHNYISDLDLKRTIQPTGTATNLSLSFMCGAFVNRVFSEDAVRGFYLKGFGNCGVGEINDSDAQIGFGSFTPNASVSYYGFYLDSTGGVPFASTILTRPGVGVGTTTGSPTIYGVYVTGSLISDVMVQGIQTESTSYGIYVDGTGGTGGFHESDLHFKDSILDGCAIACIFVTGAAATNEASIEFGGGSVGTPSGAYGIDIESSTGIAIHDIQIMPNGGMTTAGILLHSSQLISVSNNHFFGGWAGFHNPSSSLIFDGTTGSTVTGNSFQINPSGALTNVILKNTSINNALSGNWIGGGPSSVTGISADATSSNNSFLNTNAIDTAYTTKISDLGTNNQLVVSGATTNALTMNNGGSGAASGTTFDGSVARTISYNTIGAQQALTLTTTGSSGAATLSSGTLNIPQYVAGGSTSPSVTFNVATGVTASPAAPYLIAVASGTITHNCSFTTLTSDISTDLSFNVKFNGTTVLASVPATVTHGTSAGTISTFSLVGGTVTITAGQKWELDITGGTTSWTGAVQCY